MLTLLAGVVTASCMYASGRRLWFAADATALDPVTLRASLREGGGVSWLRLRREIENEPEAEWERELCGAIGAPERARAALVNEQLGELDYRAHRWARVPRVCASVSSSAGFLLAALALRAGLASDDVDIDAAILDAINVVAIGLAGASFCAATHMRARTITRDRLAAADALVERLEGLAVGERAFSAEPLGHLGDLAKHADLVVGASSTSRADVVS